MAFNCIIFFERSVLIERFVLNYENNVFKAEKFLFIFLVKLKSKIMKQALLIFCIFSFTFSNGQISRIKANDFLVNTTPCEAGGVSTVTNPSESDSGKWEISLTLGDTNFPNNDPTTYKYIMGEILFSNQIPAQVGGGDTEISDIISINSSNFELKGKALRAVDSNFECNKPSGNQFKVIRFSLLYQGTIAENDPDIEFKIFATDHGAASPVTEEILVKMIPPQTASIDKLMKYDFSFGPNPTEDFIYLSASKNIGNVEIFNLVGQKSLSTDLRASKGTLDISNLSKGIYIMNVSIDQKLGTYKLIKR